MQIPLFQESALNYQENFYTKDKSSRFNYLLEKLIYFFRWLRMLEIGHNFKRGRILDIGCGRGIMLYLLKKRGWDVHGVQISRPAADYAKTKLGLNIFVGNIIDSDYPPNFFDVITLIHVLEHLPNPDECLSYCYKLLRREGTLIIEVPNIGSFPARIFQDKWFALDLPNHIYHFTQLTMEKMLIKNGFKVIRKKYLSLEYDVFTFMQSIMNLLLPYKNSFYDSLLITKSNIKKRNGLFQIYIGLLFTAILLVPSLIFLIIFSLLRNSDTIRFYCKKE